MKIFYGSIFYDNISVYKTKTGICILEGNASIRIVFVIGKKRIPKLYWKMNNPTAETVRYKSQITEILQQNCEELNL